MAMYKGNKMNLHFRDSNFFNDNNPERPNPYLNWIWDRVPQDSDITLFSDCHLHEATTSKSRIKLAIIFEPPVINYDAYVFVRNNHNLFDYIFTYDESLLSISNKFVFIPYGTSWIGEADRKVYNKTKMTSLIASNKRWVEGHHLRHTVASLYKEHIDVMGSGYRAINSKIEGLADYRYSITIENSKFNSYFTEKLIDCLVTGVVPIYWGCPRIGDFFDLNGIIIFDSAEELDAILRGISNEDYQSRMFAIKYNLKKAEQYLSFEKYIYEFLISSKIKDSL